MLFSLTVFVLVLVVAFFQATHGLYSALIMAVLTICCAAVAVGTYEWVAVNALAPYWKAEYACPIALAVTFGVPLIILRVVSDKAIPRACLVPSWLDRAGGGICGVVTALVMVGVMALAVQMIPFHNGNIIGYARVAVHPLEPAGAGDRPSPPDEDAADSELALGLTPDRFAAGFVALLSDGLFSDSRSFVGDHPDFVEEIGWISAAPALAKPFAPPGSISVVGTEELQTLHTYRKGTGRDAPPPVYEPVELESGKTLRMIRVQIKREALLKGDRSHVFSLRQFRLVGREKDVPKHYYAVAIQQEADETPNRHVRFKQNGQYGDWPVSEMGFEPRDGNRGEVEVVFELPENFEPAFIEYKRCARAVVKFESDAGARAPARRRARTVAYRDGEQASAALQKEQPKDEPRKGRGRARGAGVKKAGSHFGDALPIKLVSYKRLKNVETKRSALVDGHLVGYVAEQDAEAEDGISKLHVPSDKRLLHLRVGNLSAKSTYGKAIGGAIKAIQNYQVEDDNGRRYVIVGKYASATVESKSVFEVQYFSSPVGKMGSLGKFDKIKEDDLGKKADLVFLFLVEPGAKIVSFSTGGTATRRDDLSGDNLVAPK